MLKPWWTKLLAPFAVFFWAFRQIEQGLYFLRDLLWNYPDTLFFGKDSFRAKSLVVYGAFRPHSHFVLAAVIMLAVLIFGYTVSTAQANTILVEAVVVGTNTDGTIQTPTFINPLIPSRTQLERDINELVYEPLIRYNADGTIQNVLAERVLRFEEGSRYGFDLRANAQWHDGSNLSVDDVFATLQLLRSLDETRFDSLALQVVKQVAWERGGQYSVLLCTLPTADLERFSRGELTRPCSSAIENRPVFANFLEVIAVKIMPAKYIQLINSDNIATNSPLINRNPIGTGPFRFAGDTDDVYSLARFDNYHSELPEIRGIRFRLYESEDAALKALENGEVHAYATFVTSGMSEIRQFPNVKVNLSNVIQNQYWAIYFNLRENAAPAYLRQKEIRQAINFATDRSLIISSLFDVGQPAQGPIARDSVFNNTAVNWAEHNTDRAKELITAAGWQQNAEGIFEKDGQRLQIILSYVPTLERQKVIDALSLSWKAAGIELIENRLTDRDTINAAANEKQFTAIIYSVQTYLDPDRFELFHSSQVGALNLSGYIGSQTRKAIRDRQTVDIPEVDFLLESARGLNPQEAQERRIELYKEFQQLLFDDMPAVFLYRPQFIYYTQRRVDQIKIDNALNLEQRFLQIAQWAI